MLVGVGLCVFSCLYILVFRPLVTSRPLDYFVELLSGFVVVTCYAMLLILHFWWGFGAAESSDLLLFLFVQVLWCPCCF
jgi:hypothetical protein